MSNSIKKPLADVTNTNRDGDEKTRVKHYECCVPQCVNITNKTTLDFYRFPTANPNFPHRNARRNEWLKVLRLQQSDGSSWVPDKNARICGAHFVGNKISNDPRSPSYNPTIFPPIYKKPLVNNLQVMNRYKRAIKRPNQQVLEDSKVKRGKMDLTVADKVLFLQENVNVNHTDHVALCSGTENESSHSAADVSTKMYIDCGIQANFLVEDVVQDTFICNRYIFPTTCDAETLCYAAGSKGKVKIEAQAKTEHKEQSKKKDRQSTSPSTSSQEKSSCNKGFIGYESIKDEQALVDLAGVSRATFQLFVRILLKDQSNGLSDLRKKISNENRVLIFLMKMKCGLTFSALSVFFQVHRTTVSRIFYTTLDYFSVACRNFVRWPDKLVVQETMPIAFQEAYSNCRVIIDATEFCVESPPSIEEKVQFFSHYKKGYRIKIVVGCTPGGFISLVTQCHGGRGTDAQITVGSDLLKLLEPGDIVLADKGFPQIKSMLDERGDNVLVVMPPFLQEDEQFTEEQVTETYSVASVRIHIERIMQRIRTHKIVDKLTMEMLPYMDKIIFMTCVLVNLQRPIIKENKN